MGTEQVVLLFKNVGSGACWLAGLPTLTAVSGRGHVSKLAFHASADPAYINSLPATGPGSVAPGGFGALHLSLGLAPACMVAVPRFVTLQLRLGPSNLISMPFPKALALPGYFDMEGQIGPAAAG